MADNATRLPNGQSFPARNGANYGRAITGSNFYAVDEAIDRYVKEAYTSEKRLVTSGIVKMDESLDHSMESYIGQQRFMNNIDPAINRPSLTDSTPGVTSTINTFMQKYIKGASSFGYQVVNMQKMITKVDAFEAMGAQVAETIANDRQNKLAAVLRGVIGSEIQTGRSLTSGTGASAIYSFGGGIVDHQENGQDPDKGFFIDLNAAGDFGKRAVESGTTEDQTAARTLSGTITHGGAANFERLFEALGMGFSDHEPDYMYMVTSPQMYASLRSAALIDQDRVTDGNIDFQTIFDGKFRLLASRMNLNGFQSKGTASGFTGPNASPVNPLSTKTTLLLKPGAICYNEVPVDDPVETDRDPAAFRGGGATVVWMRWAQIFHPIGYDWIGAEDDFASDGRNVDRNGKARTDGLATVPADSLYQTATNWKRRFEPLNLGILPIFHS